MIVFKERAKLGSTEEKMLGSTFGIDDGDTLGTYEGFEFGPTIVAALGPTDGVSDEANYDTLYIRSDSTTWIY